MGIGLKTNNNNNSSQYPLCHHECHHQATFNFVYFMT